MRSVKRDRAQQWREDLPGPGRIGCWEDDPFANLHACGPGRSKDLPGHGVGGGGFGEWKAGSSVYTLA